MSSLDAPKPSFLEPLSGRGGALTGLGFGQPDARRNPYFWMRSRVYGGTLIRRTLQAARGARAMVDLGCGSGWLSLELARMNSEATIWAVDRDLERLFWGRDWYRSLQNPDKPRLGQIHHVAGPVEAFEMEERSLDVAILFFSLGAFEGPEEVLERVHHALKPGGLLVYYDSAEVPHLNLDRLARVLHRLARFRGRMSDLWNQHRALEARYQNDAVRRFRNPEGPPESVLYHRMEELFDLDCMLRTRPFIDLYLDGLSARWAPFTLPFLKGLDTLSLTTAYLEGACRYVVARKR